MDFFKCSRVACEPKISQKYSRPRLISRPGGNWCTRRLSTKSCPLECGGGAAGKPAADGLSSPRDKL